MAFKIELWVLYPRHLLIIVNIFTKYHEDTQQLLVKLWTRQSIYYKIITFDLLVWPWPLTESWAMYATQLYIIVKIFTECHENVTNTCEVMAQAKYWPLTSKCDLYLWHTVMGLVHDTPTNYSEQFTMYHIGTTIWPRQGIFTSVLPLTS